MKRILMAALVVAVAALALPATADVFHVGTGGRVTCGTSATIADDPSVPATVDRSVMICVPDTAATSVQVGGASVTTSTGITVRPGKCFVLPERLRAGTSLYCVAISATAVEVIATR